MKGTVTLVYTAVFAKMTIRRKYKLPEEVEEFEKKCNELWERKVDFTVHYQKEG